MKLLSIIIILLFTMSSQENNSIYPDFRNKSLGEIQKNQEWEILVEARGDLMEDSKEDRVVILQSKDSLVEKRCETCEVENHKARIILVLKNKDNEFVVTTQNNIFIARADEGGMTTDMKPKISIVNKQLILSYTLIRGERDYTFESNGDDVELIKATNLSTSHYIFRYDVIDFRKQILVTESRSEKDEPINTKTTKLTLDKKLKKLSELKMMGTWDVGGVFL